MNCLEQKNPKTMRWLKLLYWKEFSTHKKKKSTAQILSGWRWLGGGRQESEPKWLGSSLVISLQVELHSGLRFDWSCELPFWEGHGAGGEGLKRENCKGIWGHSFTFSHPVMWEPKQEPENFSRLLRSHLRCFCEWIFYKNSLLWWMICR